MVYSVKNVAPEESEASMRALLVEPDPSEQQALAEALSQQGVEVVAASDADAACAIHSARACPLVLVDVDRVAAHAELACRLRSADCPGPTWIVALTRSRESERFEALLAAGIDDVLPLPADRDALGPRLAVARERINRCGFRRECDLCACVTSGHCVNRCRLLRRVPCGVFRSSVEGRFLEANPALVKMLGYESEAELLAVDLARDVYQDPAHRARLVAEGAEQLTRFELAWKRKDGTPITVSLSGVRVRDEQGNLLGFEGMIEDITAAKQAAELLGQSEATLRGLVQNMPDLVLIVDPEGVIHYVNRPAPGVSSGDLVGRSSLALVKPEYHEACREALRRACESREVQHVVAADLRNTQWSCRLVPMVQGQSLVHLMVICADVTEQKRAEEAVAKEQELLRRVLDLFERDRQLVAFEIHDGLAQQLSGALLNLEAAVQPATPPEQARRAHGEGLRLLRESVEETRRLVRGLYPPALASFGLVSAIEHFIEKNEATAGIQIEFAASAEFPRLARPLENAIFRIVQESLTNACRHSGAERVRVELVREDNRVRVSVRDSGVGFDVRQVQPDCFGLTGIRERARLFGGSALIEARPGKGTRITVELPLVPPPPEPPPTDAPS